MAMKNEVDKTFTKNRNAFVNKVRFAQKNWYQEFLDSGAQYRMTYAQFKKQKSRKNRK